MKKLFSSQALVCTLFLLASCNPSGPREDKGEWITLFNGTDIKDWIVKIHHHEAGVNFGNTFRVEDSIIRVVYDQYGQFDDQFGHLYYKKQFSNFHLKLEYRFVGELQPGAPSYTLRNSGVMFHSQDPHTMPKEQNWPISVEMQFLGGLSDGKPRSTGNMCSPGTEIVYNGSIYPDHCLNSTSKTYDGDQWVKAELIVFGDSLVTHIINGDTVLRYSKPQMGGGVVQGFDSTLWKPGQLLSSGFIALQSEGQPVDFRRISIRELKR
ncbi:DUF1080 domain-containing protein [soil metagenome]